MLRDEIRAYKDGAGYVCPNIPIPYEMKGCDNGAMYTSELYVMLKLRGEDSAFDAYDWATLIQRCMQQPGLLWRSPNDYSQDGPDNMIAVLAASKVLGVPDIAQSILSWGLSHKGCFNNVDVDKFTWQACLFRQPQLIYAALCAANKVRWWHAPLALWSAITIAIAGFNSDVNLDTDARRLSWFLSLATQDSWLCRQATKIWKWKLLKDYPGQQLGNPGKGLEGVRRIYFQKDHPFIIYSGVFY